MACKSCWHIIWRLTYKKDVFKIIQKFRWTQHGICYINMTMFLHWFFFLVRNKNRSFLRTVTYPPRLLCHSYRCVHRTHGPAWCEAAVDTDKHPLCCVESYLGQSFPLYNSPRPPSLIVFSVSRVTSLTPGMWPQKGRKHTLVLILQGLWCLLTLLVISQDQEHRVTLKKRFLPDRTKWEVPRIVCVSPMQKGNILGARQFFASPQTESLIAKPVPFAQAGAPKLFSRSWLSTGWETWGRCDLMWLRMILSWVDRISHTTVKYKGLSGVPGFQSTQC